MAGEYNVLARLKFDKVIKEWSMDSRKRVLSMLLDDPLLVYHHIHLRQIVGTAEEYFYIGHIVTLWNVLIINRDANNTITYGRYGETHMFKLKPGEIAFVSPKLSFLTFGIQASANDTKVDFIAMGTGV